MVALPIPALHWSQPNRSLHTNEPVAHFVVPQQLTTTASFSSSAVATNPAIPDAVTTTPTTTTTNSGSITVQMRSVVTQKPSQFCLPCHCKGLNQSQIDDLDYQRGNHSCLWCQCKAGGAGRNRVDGGGSIGVRAGVVVVLMLLPFLVL